MVWVLFLVDFLNGPNKMQEKMWMKITGNLQYLHISNNPNVMHTTF